MKEFDKRLADEFLDKEYAHSYMESHSVSRIAAQVYALRKQRGWSQVELSEISGIAQERISKIESADFNSLTMKTLQKLSRAFDIHLHIAFESFTSGIEDIDNLHPWQLVKKSREEDLRSFVLTSNYLLKLVKGEKNLRMKVESEIDSPHALSGERPYRIPSIKLDRIAQTMEAAHG